MTKNLNRWIGSIALLLVVGGSAVGVASWKRSTQAEAAALAAGFPEPAETVAVAVAAERGHVDKTTSIATVLALRSVTLRTEMAGAVRETALVPGQIVEPGTVLLRLDVSVEEAELRAQEAQRALAESTLVRVEKAIRSRAASDQELDRARAERDMALAQASRTRAIIERKTVRAPFRARVGLADIHPGQYLPEGAALTTLQSIDDAAHLDFSVPQAVAETLRPGSEVELPALSATARVIAVDARVDSTTRTARVRARIDGRVLAPGSSVRIRIPVGPAVPAVAVPASSLRKGPEGDHVFVIAPGQDGQPRAHLRRVRGGALLGDDVLILHGLAAGERVAASGSFKLREGALVAVAPDPVKIAGLAR